MYETPIHKINELEKKDFPKNMRTGKNECNHHFLIFPQFSTLSRNKFDRLSYFFHLSFANVYSVVGVGGGGYNILLFVKGYNGIIKRERERPRAEVKWCCRNADNDESNT